jgi:CRP-like cAMP-binding protein
MPYRDRPSPKTNLLLRRVTEDCFERWQSKLRWIDFRVGWPFYAQGDQITHALFPVVGVFSMVMTLEDGETVETATVGREGFVGFPLALGASQSINAAIVKVAGGGYTLDATTMRTELLRFDLHNQTLFWRYTQAILAQASRMTGCAHHHQLEQRLCRWLLQILDRVDQPVLQLTHQIMAERLSVRREGISTVAAALQEAGVIQYSRGRLEIIDRKGLEQRSCECYRGVVNDYRRLLDPGLFKTQKS